MINFNDIIKENIKKHNPSWPQNLINNQVIVIAFKGKRNI